MTYRPLPDYLVIKKSDVEGVGLFTNEVIIDDIEIGITHVKDIRFEDDYIRTPLGGFINHSDNPNCKVEGKEIILNNYKLKTIRDIQAGEELTLKYTLYKINKND